MNKRNIGIIAIIIVLLAAVAGGFWKYQKNHTQKSSSPGMVLADKQRNLTADNEKIYTDRIVKAENYMRSLNSNQENFRQEQSNTYVYLGQQYFGLGRLQKSKEMFEAAIKIYPKNEQAFVGLALTLEDAVDREGQRAALKQALEINPRNADIWLRYIDSRKIMGATGSEMENLFQDGLKATDRDINLAVRFAGFQESAGNIDKAISLWQEAVKLYPSNAAVYQSEIKRLERIKK